MPHCFSPLATPFGHWTCTGQPSARGPVHPNGGGCEPAEWVWNAGSPLGLGEKKRYVYLWFEVLLCSEGIGTWSSHSAWSQLRAPLLTALMLMGMRRAPGSLSENPDRRTNCCTVALLMKLSGCFRAARVPCYVCYLQSQVTGRMSCPAPVVDLHAEITQQSATNCKICHLQQCLQHCF